ncbi:ATP-dependent RNA helicase MRH4, mitochondrial [Saccharata proteae CBS 121410]|uniref:RNA helicase n=1 Tax=Saccharata proteae CBS 121410 TaxID=1314787 RepID=A0A9P4HTG0_9PEZI|nr:ATP-dependent RNA helicase MRH4, mitochondrial [Saccharata proteae CBS 121410]
MFRAAGHACIFCEIRALLPVRVPAAGSPWQTRSYAHQARSKPSRPRSRMDLSPSVGKPSNPFPSRGGKSRQSSGDPFATLNRTRAPSDLAPPAPRKEAETAGYSANRRESPRDQKKQSTKDSFHALKMQRTLDSVSYNRRSEIKESIAELESFTQFPLLPSIQDAITEHVLPRTDEPFPTPTPAQRVAIPALLEVKGDSRTTPRSKPAARSEMQQFLLAAETGSGKTLAYLLPTIDAIKRAEVAEKEEEERVEESRTKSGHMFDLAPPPLDSESRAGRPRAIVLVPTAELVLQVGAVAKAFSHNVRYRSALISAASSGTVIRNRLYAESGIDVLICTPRLLASIAESDPDVLSRVSHLIVDEADSLFDRSFAPITSSIIDKATPSLRQLILCSATIPRSLDRYLRERFPEMRRLVTPNLHAIPRRVQLGVVDVQKTPYKGDKDLACADTIYSIGKSVVEHSGDESEANPIKRIMVFVNEREKAVEVAEYLSKKGIDAIALNRDTEDERAKKLLASFTGEKKTNSKKDKSDAMTEAVVESNATAKSHRSLPGTKVIVTTDLGARGIDTVAVRHVILYDVPHSTIDFIHRLGRTGRMGRRGRGIVLVDKHDRSDVVKEVREGMFKGQALI